MKQCPECKRVYKDDSFEYCLDDGSALVYGPATTEPQTQILFPSDSATQSEILSDTTNKRSSTAKNLRARWFGLAAALIIIIGTGLFVYRYYNPTSGFHVGSIAVMPFVNESGDPDLEYLSDGMTESLINSLSELPDLNVKARSSVFRFKDKDVDVPTIGSQLGVDALLNGRLVKHGDGLTVYISLVNARTGNQTWGTQYSQKIADLLTLQSDIAKDISQKLKTKLSGSDQQRLAKNYTNNVEAYQLYLRGRYNLSKLTPAGIQAGISYFKQAIEIDGNYALAYVGLSTANRALVLSADMPSSEFFPKAKAAAQRAVEIDDSLADAHAVLGFTIFWYDWDWSLSEREFKRAIELNPNSADAHWGYGHLLSNTGRHAEALAEMKLARELDPLSLIISSSEGLYLIQAGQPDEGIARLQKVVELEPNYWFAHMQMANGYCNNGNYDRAIAEARHAIELNPASSISTAFLGYALAKAGNVDEARKLLDGMINSGRYVPPSHVALIFQGLGDKEHTFQWLEKGVEQRDPKMTFMNIDIKYDSLRGTAQFEEILKKIGFR